MFQVTSTVIARFVGKVCTDQSKPFCSKNLNAGFFEHKIKWYAEINMKLSSKSFQLAHKLQGILFLKFKY